MKHAEQTSAVGPGPAVAPDAHTGPTASADRPAAHGRGPRIFAVVLLSIVAFALDRPLYRPLLDLGLRTEDTLRDVHRLTRAFGSAPLWLLVAAALASLPAAGRVLGRRERIARLWLVLGSILSAGLASVVLKGLLRRERPRAHAGEYFFRAWFDDAGSRSGFGLPSGETAVAFAGAFVLLRLFPRLGPLWLVVAAGCGFQRMVVGAHFLSDVWVSALVGTGCAAVVWRALEPRAALAMPASPPMPPRRILAICVGLWLALLGLSLAKGWRPVEAGDLPGVYLTPDSSTREAYWRFDPDGTYAWSELRGDPECTLTTGGGGWIHTPQGLVLDGEPPAALGRTRHLLRIDRADGVLVLRRVGRLPASP